MTVKLWKCSGNIAATLYISSSSSSWNCPKLHLSSPCQSMQYGLSGQTVRMDRPSHTVQITPAGPLSTNHTCRSTLLYNKVAHRTTYWARTLPPSASVVILIDICWGTTCLLLIPPTVCTVHAVLPLYSEVTIQIYYHIGHIGYNNQEVNLCRIIA